MAPVAFLAELGRGAARSGHARNGSPDRGFSAVVAKVATVATSDLDPIVFHSPLNVGHRIQPFLHLHWPPWPPGHSLQ
jgi:hypothetical protein